MSMRLSPKHCEPRVRLSGKLCSKRPPLSRSPAVSAADPKFAQVCGALGCELRVQKRHYKDRVASVLIDSEVRTSVPRMLTNFGIGTLVNFSPQYVAAHACTLAQQSRSVKAKGAARLARSAAPFDGAGDHPAARCGMWTRV